MRSDHGQKLVILLSAFFSLAVIAYVGYRLDWVQVRSTFMGMNWFWVIAALLVYVVNYILRTFRLKIILPLKQVPFFQLLGLTGLYGMYNYLLPVGSGEATLVVLLKYRLRVSVADGLASLIASRYFDFSAVAFILGIVMIVNRNSFPSWAINASILFCAAILVASLLLFYVLQNDSFFSWKVFQSQYSIIQKIKQFLMRLRDGLVKIHEKHDYLRLLFLTLAIWLCVYTNYYLIVVGLGYQVTYFQIIVVSVIMIALTFLPVQGFANFGTHEIGWVIAFSIFSQRKEIALNIAFSTHILLLFFVILLGACSYIIESVVYKKRTLGA